MTVTFGVRNFEDLDACLGEMCRVLRKGGHLVPVKAAMKEIGFDCGGCRLPLTALASDKLEQLKTVLLLRE